MIMMGDKKKALTAILGPLPEEVEGDAPNELHAIAQEAIEAIHAKDAAGFSDALSAAFALLDSQPHVEGPHED